jgi:hypothetical protein
MKNPKTWSGPTSWNHKALNDKSGPDKNLSAHGRPTNVSATPMSHFKVVPKSGEGHPGLGNKSTIMGEPKMMSSDRSEMPISAKAGKVDKSATMVPSEPKKWHKKGYNMSQEMSDGQASSFNKKEKAQ